MEKLLAITRMKFLYFVMLPIFFSFLPHNYYHLHFFFHFHFIYYLKREEKNYVAYTETQTESRIRIYCPAP